MGHTSGKEDMYRIGLSVVTNFSVTGTFLELGHCAYSILSTSKYLCVNIDIPMRISHTDAILHT